MTKRVAEEVDLHGEERPPKKLKLENTNDPFTTLPDELVVQMLSHIPPENLEGSGIIFVCSRYARLMSKPEFWRTYCLSRWGENIAPNLWLENETVEDEFVIPLVEPECLVPDWRKYCFFRSHFQQVWMRLEPGTTAIPYNEAVDLKIEHVVSVVKAFKQPPLDVLAFPLYIEFLEYFTGREELSGVIQVFTVASSLMMMQRRSDWDAPASLLKKAYALLSLCDKMNSQDFFNTLEIPWRHVLLSATETFKQLSSRKLTHFEADIDSLLKRLTYAWLRYLIRVLLYHGEEWCANKVAHHNFPVVIEAPSFDSRAAAEFSDHHKIILRIAEREYFRDETDWILQLTALAVARWCWGKNTDAVTRSFEIALNAVKQPNQIVQGTGALFIYELALELTDTPEEVKLAPNIVISALVALLDSMTPNSHRFFYGISKIVSYCHANNVIDWISDELVTRIHNALFEAASDSSLAIMELVKESIELFSSSFQGRSEPYQADYQLILEQIHVNSINKMHSDLHN